MGCYNTIIIRCPVCHEKLQWQTKSGDCSLSTYELHEAPIADLGAIVGDTALCECGRILSVHVQFIATVVVEGPEQ